VTKLAYFVLRVKQLRGVILHEKEFIGKLFTDLHDKKFIGKLFEDLNSKDFIGKHYCYIICKFAIGWVLWQTQH